MKFKDYYTHNILLEDVNIGDTFEGIFAIAVALQISYGHVTRKMVHDVRRDIDITGNKEAIIDANIKENPLFDNIVSDPNDILQVRVKLNLRKQNVKGMFGRNIIKNDTVDEHIDTLISKVNSLSIIDKIQRFMVKILTNKKTDEVVFYVVADGVGNSTSRGKIKGDVVINIEAKTKTQIPKDLQAPLSFSLKTESDIISNLGIFSGILKLGKLFELDIVSGLYGLDVFPDKYSQSINLVYEHQDKWEDDSHIIYYLRRYLQVQDRFMSKPDNEYEGGADERKSEQAKGELQLLENLLTKFIDEFSSQIEQKDSERFNVDPRSTLFTSRISRFLQSELFGEDKSDFIRISKDGIQELKYSELDDLKDNHVINFKQNGSKMLFYKVNINNESKLLFRIRPRIEYNSKSKIKTQVLVVELGDI
jgi:hypothetical protein